MTLALSGTPEAIALRRDLQRLLKRYAKGERPSQDMVATMAFVTGYLFFAMSDGDLSDDDLVLFIPTHAEAGHRQAAEGVVTSGGGRQ